MTKEAAPPRGERPKSREETPKKGMRSRSAILLYRGFAYAGMMDAAWLGPGSGSLIGFVPVDDPVSPGAGRASWHEGTAGAGEEMPGAS